MPVPNLACSNSQSTDPILRTFHLKTLIVGQRNQNRRFHCAIPGNFHALPDQHEFPRVFPAGVDTRRGKSSGGRRRAEGVPVGALPQQIQA